MKHALAAVFLLTLAAAPAAAQDRGQRIRPTLRGELAQAPPPFDGNAPDTQRRLQEVLQQYPPSIGQVLALDPTLLTNPNYLEPYPALATLLAQHPEIAHNPGYFLGQFRENGPRRYDYNDPKLAAIRTVEEALTGLAVLTGFLTVVGTIAWLLRSVIVPQLRRFSASRFGEFSLG